MFPLSWAILKMHRITFYAHHSRAVRCRCVVIWCSDSRRWVSQRRWHPMRFLSFRPSTLLSCSTVEIIVKRWRCTKMANVLHLRVISAHNSPLRQTRFMRTMNVAEKAWLGAIFESATLTKACELHYNQVINHFLSSAPSCVRSYVGMRMPLSCMRMWMIMSERQVCTLKKRKT